MRDGPAARPYGTGIALAALTLATAALAAFPPPAAGHAASVTRTAGNGDHNGNDTAVRVGNGTNNRSLLTIGSTRNAMGLQQSATGVSGAGNTQGTVCRQRPRVCDVTQRIWASIVETASEGTTRAVSRKNAPKGGLKGKRSTIRRERR